MQKFYTRKDVDLAFKRKKQENSYPENWIRVDVYARDIVIYVQPPESESSKMEVYQILKNWFGSRVDMAQKRFLLDTSEPNKELYFSIRYEHEVRKDEPTPLFQSFYNVDETVYPRAFENGPIMFGFHSYKGGVGRTLSALSLCRSLSKRKNYNGQPLRLLIVDADFEAPGLTWIAREKGHFRDFSLLDALSLIHDEKNWENDALNFISNKVQEEVLRLPVGGGYSEHYFLPAYREEGQLLSMPIEPQHLVRKSGKQWIIGDFLHRLGNKLGVDAVIIDLRAGISEFSSPLLFDPRIHRVLVTTTTFQSFQGNEFILKQLIERMPKNNDLKEQYPVPRIFISMVTDAANPFLENMKESLLSITYEQDKDWLDNIDPIKIIPFAEELVHLWFFEDIDEKLSGTAFEKVTDDLLEEVFGNKEELVDIVPDTIEAQAHFLKQLIEECEKTEFAERDVSDDFLKTLPLRNLAQKFSNTMPAAVIMGSKGAGKTFIYLQLVKKKLWSNFVKNIMSSKTGAKAARIIPLLSSKNLGEYSSPMIQKHLTEHRNELPIRKPFDLEQVVAKIETLVLKKVVSELEWRNFWIEMLCEICGYEGDVKDLSSLDRFLKMHSENIVVVFDGLEDIFGKVTEEESQQVAVRTLCQDIVAKIRDLPNSNIGILVFVRKDIVQQAIHQNFGQFEQLYKPFELQWNQEEALRLALWICKKADANWPIYTGLFQEIELIQQDLIEQSLHRLWGIKLGANDSREAYTSNWVLAALSDFRGQLQARDMVRFLQQAAHLSINYIDRNPNSYRPDRYLQPQSIRQSIGYCSNKKIKEVELEIPVLVDIFEKIRSQPKEDRQLPFDRETLNLTSVEIRTMENLGIVFRLDEGCYMPEIYRHALKFEWKKGARPKVLYLMKKALERG